MINFENSREDRHDLFQRWSVKLSRRNICAMQFARGIIKIHTCIHVNAYQYEE